MVSSGLKIGDDVYGLDNNGFNLVEAIIWTTFNERDSAGEKSEPILGFYPDSIHPSIRPKAVSY